MRHSTRRSGAQNSLVFGREAVQTTAPQPPWDKNKGSAVIVRLQDIEHSSSRLLASEAEGAQMSKTQRVGRMGVCGFGEATCHLNKPRPF